MGGRGDRTKYMKEMWNKKEEKRKYTVKKSLTWTTWRKKWMDRPLRRVWGSGPFCRIRIQNFHHQIRIRIRPWLLNQFSINSEKKKSILVNKNYIMWLKSRFIGLIFEKIASIFYFVGSGSITARLRESDPFLSRPDQPTMPIWGRHRP